MLAAYRIIIPASLALGVLAGFMMHRADFCFVCALRNYFLLKRTFMLRMLGIVVVISMVLFESGRRLGLLTVFPFPLLGPPSASNVIGGAIFGVGMVLAGGCAIGTLYRAGAGSIISMTALLGLVVGSGLYIPLHPSWVKFIRATTMSGAITIPQLLHIDPSAAVAVALVIAVALGYRWRRKTWLLRFRIEKQIQPVAAAGCLAIIGLLMSVVSGMPMGVTTTYTKAASFVTGVVYPEFAEKSSYMSAQPFKFPYPFTGELLTGGGGPAFDAIAAIQLPLIVGLVGGGMLSAILLGEYAVHLKVPRRQIVSAFTGGILMGMASRLTPGCNIWHVCGGLPIFALQSILFVAGLVPGAWIGTTILVKWVIRP